jgi:O-acetyl-ADP-ribose deacetylase (regulator of RNase III)
MPGGCLDSNIPATPLQEVLVARRISVFICYKKWLSQKRDDQLIRQKNTEAEILHYLLSAHGSYEPWVDNAQIAAGMTWEMEIYRQLLKSDVVVALVGPGTSESEWVRREIALAKALGISVVPVGFDLTDEQMAIEAKALSIDDIQWVITRNINLQRGPALVAELGTALDKACGATRERQRAVLSDLWMRQRIQKRKALDSQSVASYGLPPPHGRAVVIVASGDMAKVRDVDVLVNSENNYMQMARFFESQTVSSILRHRGSRIKDGRYEDTIQQELDWQLRDRVRPVQACEVFPTSAGARESQLASVNRARVILHVAAVQAVEAEGRIIPYKQPHQIESAVRGALSSMSALNDVSVVFSPQGSDQRAEQERLSAMGRGVLESIMFPLLGTGTGGAETGDVVAPMIDGLVGYLADRGSEALGKVLKRVYISAYTEEDVGVVMDVLGSRLELIHG